jgi:spore germination cell wall hydrolase CwlJ-like protein
MTDLKFDDHDIDIMGRTIYGEARGEPGVGQVAVAWVIRNRAERAEYAGPNHGMPGAIATVCLKPWQFSCWNRNDPNLPKLVQLPRAPQEPPQFEIARRVCGNVIPDPTNGADLYYVSEMEDPPSWAFTCKVVAQIGAHTFLDSRVRV